MTTGAPTTTLNARCNSEIQSLELQDRSRPSLSHVIDEQGVVFLYP